jgi:hypothetical protein
VAVLAALSWRLEMALILCAAVTLLIPLTILFISLENLLFLLCPSSPAANLALSNLFQGRRQLLRWGASVVHLLATGLAAGLGIIAYFIAGGSLVAAIAAGWIVLAAFDVAVISLLALAFERFDVAGHPAQ